MRKPMPAETRRKISAARAKAWAQLSPEIRKERTDKSLAAWRRNQQISAIRDGRLRSAAAVATFSVDDDFDEGF